MPPRPEQPGTRALLAVLLLPILAAYAIMARFALNVPLIDDYPTVLGFATRYQALPTPAARLHLILADQYTEYKLVFIHCVTAAQLALTGHVSFAATFWLGQLSLLGLLALCWKSWFRTIPDTRRRLLLFTPIVLLLFTLNYGEALDWLSTTIGYLLTIFLSLTALFLLAEGRSSRRPLVTTALAALAAFLACSIAANAFFLAPLGLIPLLRAKNRLPHLALWSSAFLLALFPYAVHYHKELHTGTGSPLLIPLFFVDFVGAAAPFAPHAFPHGLCILALLLAALRHGILRTHPAATLGVTWLLISAALAALGRGRTGLAFATASRYKIYSDLFLIFCYGSLAERFLTVPTRTSRRLLTAAIALAILFCLRGDHQGYNILRNRQSLLRAAFARYRQSPTTNSPVWFNDPAVDNSTPIRIFATQSLEDINHATAAHLYNPPTKN